MRYIDADALVLKTKRHLMPNVDIDGTVSVEDAERWFLRIIEETTTADVAPRANVAREILEKVKKTAEAYFYGADSVATTWFLDFCEHLEKKYESEGAEDD